MNNPNITFFVGPAVTLIGFLFYLIVESIYFYNHNYTYYTTNFFYVSVIVMAVGFVLWWIWLAKEMASERKERKEE